MLSKELPICDDDRMEGKKCRVILPGEAHIASEAFVRLYFCIWLGKVVSCGMTLLSSAQTTLGNTTRHRLTSKDVSFQMLVPRKAYSTIGAEDILLHVSAHFLHEFSWGADLRRLWNFQEEKENLGQFPKWNSEEVVGSSETRKFWPRTSRTGRLDREKRIVPEFRVL